LVTAIKIRRVQTTDRSVRDHPQRVIVMSDIITVQSFVGRVKVSEYNISRRDWESLASNPECCNINWSQSRFVFNHTQQYDNEPGGPCQAERIRDSQIRAINLGIQMWKEQV
jgi:hypothetical protein